MNGDNQGARASVTVTQHSRRKNYRSPAQLEAQETNSVEEDDDGGNEASSRQKKPLLPCSIHLKSTHEDRRGYILSAYSTVIRNRLKCIFDRVRTKSESIFFIFIFLLFGLLQGQWHAISKSWVLLATSLVFRFSPYVLHRLREFCKSKNIEPRLLGSLYFEVGGSTKRSGRTLTSSS